MPDEMYAWIICPKNKNNGLSSYRGVTLFDLIGNYLHRVQLKTN